MPSTIVTSMGKICLSDDIIATIAGYAAIENYGLVGMSAQTVSDNFISLLKMDNYKRGVTAKSVDNQIEIDLYVMFEYGVSLIAVAQNVISNVRYRVQEITGIPVSKVNVHIEKIRVNA